MAIFVTMEVGPVDWSKFKAALDWSRAYQAPGRLSSHVYRSESDPGQVLVAERWLSHDQMHEFQDKVGEEFNKRAGTESLEWKDVVWTLAEQI